MQIMTKDWAAQLNDIAARRAAGETLAAIAKAHDISTSTVRRWLTLRQPAADQSVATVSQSRDGQWLYSYTGCGYTVDVLRRPTGRTAVVSGGISAARRMAQSGALLALVAEEAAR